MTTSDNPINTTPLMNPIDALELRVLDLTPEQSTDVAALLITNLDAMKKRIREIEDQLKPRLIEHINAHGPIVIGPVRYYVDFDKDTKCIDGPTVLDAIFTVAKGDMSMACDGLSVNAFKPGWAKKNLPADVYEKCFKTEVKSKLKSDGEKPVKQLQKIDTSFQRY